MVSAQGNTLSLKYTGVFEMPQERQVRPVGFHECEHSLSGCRNTVRSWHLECHLVVSEKEGSFRSSDVSLPICPHL